MCAPPFCDVQLLSPQGQLAQRLPHGLDLCRHLHGFQKLHGSEDQRQKHLKAGAAASASAAVSLLKAEGQSERGLTELRRPGSETHYRLFLRPPPPPCLTTGGTRRDALIQRKPKPHAGQRGFDLNDDITNAA